MLNRLRRSLSSAPALARLTARFSRSVASVLLLSAIGCAAQGTSSVPGDSEGTDTGGNASTTSGGSSGSSTTSSAGTASPSGGSSATTSGGSASTAGSSTSSAGTSSSSAGHGGSGGTSSGSAGSAGAGNTGPVTVGLPFTEDWESGMISSSWTALATQVIDPAHADWSIVSDDTGKAAQLNSDGTERFLVGGNSAWTDQKLELRVQVVSGSPEIDIAFRFRAVKEYYYLEFADSHFKVRDRTGANSDLMLTGDKPAVATGTWYKLTLQIKGTAVSASLNDMVIASGTFASTPIAAGGIAIGVGSGSGVVLFDDIHVTAP